MIFFICSGLRSKGNSRRSAYFFITLIFLSLTSFFLLNQKQRPVLFIIGDSTVKNGKGKGDGGQWGWGDFMSDFFDTTRIKIENKALGGTSSRTFQTRHLWDSVLMKIKAGDYLLVQFGHNDGGPLDDTSRARGNIRGNGEESREVYNPIMKKNEVVHTYGWYIRKYIKDAKAKGAVAIVLSPIPRNIFVNAKINRASGDYGKWAADASSQENALFVYLNKIVADQYDRQGEEQVKKYFTTADHTHTSEAGAKLNAASVVAGIAQLKRSGLAKYLRKSK